MPTKRGLVIGINSYPQWEPHRQLTGCVNDARLMHAVLQSPFGFPADQLTLLLDAQATRDGILAALDALVAATQPDDIVVVYYAGHGSQITDLEYDEPSGYDSTLVPHDSGRAEGTNRDITDDELAVRVQGLARRTRFTTLIFDCCHSGTITRDVAGTVRTRSLPADTRPRGVLIQERTALPPSAQAESGPSGWLSVRDSHVLIAGCRDGEESSEYHATIDGAITPHGALTWYITRELLAAGPSTTYRDIFEAAASRVTSNYAAQHPQMEGQVDRVVFGTAIAEPERYLRVSGRSGDVVALPAGAVHGVTVGSRYDIHAPGTKAATGATRLGEVAITRVRSLSADARITSEATAGGIVADCRAFEVEHAYGSLRLRVALPPGDGGPVAALRALVEQTPHLELADDPVDGVRIHLLPARTQVAANDPVPRVGALSRATWAVTSPGGDVVAPLKPAGEERAVVDNLTKLARYRHGLAVDNPRSALQGRFTLELLRFKDGHPILAEAGPGGQVEYEEGEHIAFRVKSTHDRPVYLALIDFGITGATMPLLPYDTWRAEHELRAGGEFDYDLSDPFKLEWPAGYPYADTAGHELEASGIDTVRLFVTEEPADFSAMSQAGMRGGPAPLEDVLRATFHGASTRDVRRQTTKDADWTVVTRSFVVRRRATATLTGQAQPLTIGNATVTAPGLQGNVEVRLGRQARERAAAQMTPHLHEALQQAGITEGQTIELSDARTTGPTTRSVGGQPAFELQLSDPGPDQGQLVMAIDELGVVSWIPAAGGTRSLEGTRRFVIPCSEPDARADAPVTRGLVSTVGRKILKELVFPLIDPVLGKVGDRFVSALEARRWPYRVRAFGPEDFATDTHRPVDWSSLGSGRALLFVHGTFSRAHLAFATLPPALVAELHRRYEGRVFAFDHFTLSQDPMANVRWFLSHMPDGTALDVDIVCHSRGGLVSRCFAERWSELDAGRRELKVGKVVFVGSPNAGTPLANATRMGDLIDVLTNLLDALPDNGITDVLTMIVSVAKHLAVGTTRELDGLNAMDPTGAFTSTMNRPGQSRGSRYFAVSSHVAPGQPGIRRLLVTKGLEQLFGGGSDLVVPTAGVYEANGAASFPIEERLVLSGGGAVTHTKYFADPQVQQRLLEWLQ